MGGRSMGLGGCCLCTTITRVVQIGQEQINNALVLCIPLLCLFRFVDLGEPFIFSYIELIHQWEFGVLHGPFKLP